MPILVYRIQKKRFLPSLLSGEGARLYGGRWNPVGTPLVYASGSPELAFLEMLVHLDGAPFSDLPPYVLATLALPDGSVETIAEAELPPHWNELPSPDYAAQFLLPRLQPNNPFLGFAVPSSALPGSPTRNVLLNPLHPLMRQVEIVTAIPLALDKRLRPELIATAPIKRASRGPAKRKPKI